MVKRLFLCFCLFITIYFIYADTGPLARPILFNDGGEFYDFAEIKFRKYQDPAVEIRYTIDNSDVSENSFLYSQPFKLWKNTIIRARAFKKDFKPSEELVQFYNIPNIPQNLNVFTNRDSIFVSWTPPDFWSDKFENIVDPFKTRGYNLFVAEITSEPAPSNPVFRQINSELIIEPVFRFNLNKQGNYQIYVQAVTIENFDIPFVVEPESLFVDSGASYPVSIAILVDPDPTKGIDLTNHSEIINFELKQVQNFTIHPSPGIYFEPITISFQDTSAEIHYTLDRFIPDDTSNIFQHPIHVGKHTEVIIMYRGYMDNLLPSEIEIARYIVTDTVKPPVFSTPTGYYFEPFYLHMYCETEGATIFFTTDGSAPSTSSKVYMNPIPINKGTTVRAIARKNDWRTSKSVSVSYEFIDFNTELAEIPFTFQTELMKPFPNPFADFVNISFTLEKEEHLEIGIYNLLGQKITTLLSEKRGAGEHITVWNGRCEANNKVNPGVYFCQMQTKDYKKIIKVVMTTN